MSLCLMLSFVGCSGSADNVGAGVSNEKSDPEYFEECDFLPTPDSVIKGVDSKGHMKSSTNGVTTKIEYSYGTSGDISEKYSEYLAYLESSGITVQNISDSECSVISDSMKVASVTISGSSMEMNIIPEDFRVATVVKNLETGSSETLDFAQFTFNTIEISKEMYPEDASGVCLYYSETEGSTYVTLRGRVKNLAADNLDSRYINAVLTINDKYTYTAEVIFGANPASITDYAITPFEESPLYIVFTVPNDAVSVMNDGLITVQFNENFGQAVGEYEYTYNFVVPC